MSDSYKIYASKDYVDKKVGSLSEEMVPSTDQPHMQLVTDANGKKVWEEKLAYMVEREKIIYNGITFWRVSDEKPIMPEGKTAVAVKSQGDPIFDVAYKAIGDDSDIAYEIEGAAVVIRSNEAEIDGIGYVSTTGVYLAEYSDYFVFGVAMSDIALQGGALDYSWEGNHYIPAKKITAELMPDKYTLMRNITFASSKAEFDAFEYDVRQSDAYGHIAGDIIISALGEGRMSSFERFMMFKEGENGALDCETVSYNHPTYRNIDGNRYMDTCPAVAMANGSAAELRRKGVIIRSSTLDSLKAFAITVDDSGTLTAVEVPAQD